MQLVELRKLSRPHFPLLACDELSVRLLNPGKCSLQAVVIRLRDRIEFVIVATGAADREAEESRARGRTISSSVFARICAAAFASWLPTSSYGPATRNAGADLHSGRPCELIAGEVLDDEPVERFVVVDRANDVVAKRPGVVSDHVALETVAFAKADHVEPMPPPPLAVARAGEQPIDKPLVGVRRWIPR